MLIRNGSLCAALALLFVACGSPPEPAAAPEAPTPAAPEPAPAPLPEPAASAAPAEAPPPPAPAPAVVKDVLGKVAKIEVREVDLTAGVKSVRSYSKAADVEAILKALGVEQAASGPKRRCPDNVTLSFFDEGGAEKGVLGLCGGLGAKDNLEGAEFGATANDRGGVTIADAAALKRALVKAPPSAPKKDAAVKEPVKDAAKDAAKKDAPKEPVKK